MFPVSELHWIRPGSEMKDGEVRRFRVRIRYRQPLQEATAIVRGENLYVVFDEAQRSITPGQFAAFHTMPEEADNAIDAEAPELVLSSVINQ